jgi:GAF domain-containing protein
VATLVAQEPSPSEVFAAVTKETGMLLGAQRATLLRVESPQWAVVVAGWSDGALPPVPVGHRGALDGRGILGQMLRTARPVRIEDFDQVGDGAVAELMRELGIRAGAGGPIIIGGRVWGAVTVVWEDVATLPPGAEDRVAAFAELVSYAIENAETRAELAASRARLVEAADEARRRIERDLHDGAQQRFVAARLDLTLLERRSNCAPRSRNDSTRRSRQPPTSSSPRPSPTSPSTPRQTRSPSTWRPPTGRWLSPSRTTASAEPTPGAALVCAASSTVSTPSAATSS